MHVKNMKILFMIEMMFLKVLMSIRQAHSKNVLFLTGIFDVIF